MVSCAAIVSALWARRVGRPPLGPQVANLPHRRSFYWNGNRHRIRGLAVGGEHDMDASRACHARTQLQVDLVEAGERGLRSGVLDGCRLSADAG